MDKLKQLQETILEIMDVVDKFCRENNISYSLYGGTALGAVRHKGFIPWDDDLDIIMAREDYDKFIELWQKNPVSGYILQNKDNAETFKESFTKIRKDHTTFLQHDWERGLYHTGIFVDIMPFDRIPNGKLPRLLFKWRAIKYLLLVKDFSPASSTGLQKVIYRFLSLFYPKKSRRKRRINLLDCLTKYNSDKSLCLYCFNGTRGLKRIYPCDMIDSLVEVPFDGHMYFCAADMDAFLKLQYGDYMKLPPVEERKWTHHPIIIDFDRNYEELQ